MRIGSILFFSAITYFTFIAAPIYFYQHGISRSEMILFLIYTFGTSFAITMGYHRLFAHVTYKTHPLIQFLLLYFGAASFQQSALKWASQHRKHHQFTDTDLDPYNIKKGFFYAHIGWILFWKQPVNYDNVKDLQQNKMLMSQHKHYQWWAIGAGVIVPVILGALMGNHWQTSLLLNVNIRLFLVFTSAFFINSFCHTFGSADFDGSLSAKDHWLGAILTNGEGYHNFHHKFPGDYRNGYRWYHWDPTKWLIVLLSHLNLASDLKRVSDSKILEAIHKS